MSKAPSSRSDRGSTEARTSGTTVLIADDHEVVRAGIATVIRSMSGYQLVGEARNGREAVQLFTAHHPDIVLMDLRMPETDGLEALRQIREASSTARVIILTTYDTDDDIERALYAGAQAYLLKDATKAELQSCIKAVLAGQKHVAPAVAARLADRLTSVQLTAREMDVLRFICRGLSNKQIAAELFVTESTVKLHANNVFEKLGVSSRTEAMRAALQRGLVRLA